MKVIQLTQGFLTLVDDEDYERLLVFKWCVAIDSSGHAAVQHNTWKDGKSGFMLMHREVLKAPRGFEVDHICRDDDQGVIDNRKVNLRLATKSQNRRNSRKVRGGSSRFKGVCWSKQRGNWRAFIRFEGVLKSLGSYDCEDDAACAYDAAARILFGEFAHTNFPYVFVV